MAVPGMTGKDSPRAVSIVVRGGLQVMPQIGHTSNMFDLPPELIAATDALGEDGRNALLSVMVTLPDEARARRIGDLYADPSTRTMAELLIDLEADPTAKALVIAAIRR